MNDDDIFGTQIPAELRRRLKPEWRNWLLDRMMPGDIYLTLALNGSTRAQRDATRRAQQERQRGFASSASRQRGGIEPRPKRTDLGYTRRSPGRHDAGRLVEELRNRIDRYNLGARYHKKPPSERCSMVFFCENWETNLHFEGLLRIPCIKRGQCLNDVLALIPEKWRILVPSGTVNIEQVIRDVKAVAIYITKQLSRLGAWDGFFSRGEFGDPPDDQD